MKTKIQKLLLLLLVLGCSDDNDLRLSDKSKFSFESSSVQLNESDTGLIIRIVLDPPASSDGFIGIAFEGSATNPEHYIILPELVNGDLRLPINKGDETIQFLMLPINDEEDTGEKSTRLILTNSSEGFIKGENSSLTVTILDDDDPTSENNPILINFESDYASISEADEAGYSIHVYLSRPSLFQEVVAVSIGSSTSEYGIDYYTEPAAIDLLIPLVFEKGQTSNYIKLYPIDNNKVEIDGDLTFTISNWSQSIEPGNQFDFILKIINDDEETIEGLHTISELKANFNNHAGDWYIPEDYFIEGVVTGVENVLNEKTIYIQDQTGAIMMMFYAQNLQKEGNKVRLNLKGATGAIYNDHQVMIGIIDRSGTILEENILLEPEVITIPQLASGEYSGRLVKIIDATLPDANGIKRWEGSYRITDAATGTMKGVVTTYHRAGFSQHLLPKGTFSITGIVGSWNHLHLQKLSDIN